MRKPGGFVLEALELRFGEISEAVKTQINQIDKIETLEKLHREAIIATNPEQFRKILSETDTSKH